MVEQGAGLHRGAGFRQRSQRPRGAGKLPVRSNKERIGIACGAPSDVPAIVTDQLRPLSDRPGPYAARGIAYLPVLPRCRLVIVGGGHVGKAVGDLAADLEFDVWIVDDRAEFASEARFPKAQRRISGPIDRVLPDLEITARHLLSDRDPRPQPRPGGAVSFGRIAGRDMSA